MGIDGKKEINFEVAMRENYDLLTNIEKKIVDYIIKNESEIIWYTLTDLAEKIRASEAAIIRTCKKLGYTGFQEFKINMALSKIHSLTKVENEIKDIDNDGSIKTLSEKVRQMHIIAINEVFANLNHTEIENIAKKLLEARFINLFAFGGTLPIAVDLNYKLFRMGLSSAVIVDQREQRMKAALAKPGDVFWGFNFSGMGANLYDILLLARENGATIISLTSNKNSPVAKISDYKLLGVNNCETLFTGTTDRLTQLAIIDVLFLYIINLNSGEIRSALEKTLNIIAADQNKR
ncbi:MurR/RpiR family transcriptional regulator [Desulfosporosinus sp. PR]|uniref:MurR/RpiR family transcriptional regulator n=1 Tax=Candidatus Desulfosporosinus nitrosoreducens TaxID=3401928 RepID=UPI0027F7588B|nr:MurR/RpiR family transcriptional regulator [Desulfosporosinus sp. PR]MDQ7096652.1 MurR/RpiR family transcriptional regulator [Desulfosporosinus sp. PR]